MGAKIKKGSNIKEFIQIITDIAFETVRAALKKKSGPDFYIPDEPLSKNLLSSSAVSITRTNSINTGYSTFAQLENGVSIEDTAEVYSNLVDGREEQCKEIMAFICDLYTTLGYIRTDERSVTNFLDDSISRRMARFTNNNITLSNGMEER